MSPEEISRPRSASKAGASQSCAAVGRAVDMRVPGTVTRLCVNPAPDSTRVNDQRGRVPIKLYLFPRKCECRIIFVGHETVFF